MNDFLGSNIKLSLFGESHGQYVGATILGLPSGIKVDHDLIKKNLANRRPNGIDSTSRIESDEYTFISGVYNDYTNGNPVTVIIKNRNVIENSQDKLARPSHSDYTNFLKNKNFGDIRGGGFSSGRLTAPLVILETLFFDVLSKKNIEINVNTKNLSLDIEDAKKNGDSIGAKVSVCVKGIEGGLGGPYFSSLESKLAFAMLAIPGVKGIEFGLGFGFENELGSKTNDQFVVENGIVKTKSNNCGGINGGITNGNDITFNVIFKPTPSIGQEQDYFDLNKKTIVTTKLLGRNDPCIATRGKYAVKALTSFVILDELMNKYGTDLFK